VEFENLGILLDTSKAQQDLNDVERKRQQADGLLNQTQAKSKTTWMDAVRIARASWGILSNILEIAGVTLSQTLNANIQAMFLIGQQTARIATAEALTPGMAIAAALTFVQAGLMVASAYEAERKSKELSKELKDAQQMFHAVNRIVGNYAY